MAAKSIVRVCARVIATRNAVGRPVSKAGEVLGGADRGFVLRGGQARLHVGEQRGWIVDGLDRHDESRRDEAIGGVVAAVARADRHREPQLVDVAAEVLVVATERAREPGDVEVVDAPAERLGRALDRRERERVDLEVPAERAGVHHVGAGGLGR